MEITLNQLYNKEICQESFEDFKKFIGNNLEIDEWTSWHQSLMINSYWGKYWGLAVYKKIIPAWSMSNSFIENIDLSDKDLSNLDISNSIIKNVNFNGSILCGIISFQTEYYNCDFSNIDFSYANLYKTKFIKCTIQAGKFKNTITDKIEMLDCKIIGNDFL
jgi:uncharacterized protein YjbI with pentapeptide repeats